MQFYFRRTYRLGHAFHAILDLVWKGPTKKWHFCPNLTPSRFQKFVSHVFCSSPYAVCCLPGKFGWDPFSSLISPVNDKRHAQVRGRVQTRQRFLRMAWPIFVRLLPDGTNFIPLESGSVVFLTKFPCLAAMLDLMWAGPAKNNISSKWPITDFRSLTPRFFILASLPSV